MDDVITIECGLNKTESVTFRLNNVFAQPAAFRAFYTPDSPLDFAVNPACVIPYSFSSKLFPHRFPFVFILFALFSLDVEWGRSLFGYSLHADWLTAFPSDREGVLSPYNGEGTQFVVSFHASSYGKPPVGCLVIETDEMQVCDKDKRLQIKYRRPRK